MKLVIFSCLIAISLWSSPFKEFDVYQSKYTRQVIEQRLKSYLQKDPHLDVYFDLTEDAFILYSSPKDESKEIEYVLKLSHEEVVDPPLVRSSTLNGVRIAIDPGHLGGKFAHLEDRYIEIPHENAPVSTFDEGTLNLLTAKYLKLLLEKEGACVMVTRDEIGKGVYEKSFFDWLASEPQLWEEKRPLNQLFARYNSLDLRARAEKINQFKPDLTVMIHYNAHTIQGLNSNQNKTVKNYNMVFIPGAFVKQDLINPETRYEFMRLLLTQDINTSIQLSQSILAQFTKVLQIPILQESDGATYLDTVSLKIDQGIFARNLALTRLVHGPLCYGETLIQNNEKECLLLDQKDFAVDEIACSSRIKQVAEAYLKGIQHFVSGQIED